MHVWVLAGRRSPALRGRSRRAARCRTTNHLSYRVSRNSHRSLLADHRQTKQPLLSSIHSWWPRGMGLGTRLATTFFFEFFSNQAAEQYLLAYEIQIIC